MEIDNKELNDMEVDEPIKTAEEIYKERSNMNDRKILERAKQVKDVNQIKQKEEKAKKEEERKENQNQNAVKEVLKEKKIIEEEYFKCVNALTLKTEECEKLKIELKDLKQLVQLQNEAKNLDLDVTQEVRNTEMLNMQNKTATDKKNENPWQKVSYRVRKRQHSNLNNTPEN